MFGSWIHVRSRVVGRLVAALAIAGGTLTLASVALKLGPAPAGRVRLWRDARGSSGHGCRGQLWVRRTGNAYRPR